VPHEGSIALVCYVPEPLAGVLQTLRRTLPSAYDARPHITLLPPRPLCLPVRELIGRLSRILRNRRSFSVKLNDLSSFVETSLLHFEIGEGSEHLNELHSVLNSGDLRHDEVHDFKPHVTIGGPYDSALLPEVLAEAKALWNSSSCGNRFDVDEIVLLWLAAGDCQRACRYLATFALRAESDNENLMVAATVGDRT
jgi:2'-5' RNA ligase